MFGPYSGSLEVYGQGGLRSAAGHRLIFGEEEVLEAGWRGCITNQLLTSCRASPGCSWAATEVEE